MVCTFKKWLEDTGEVCVGVATNKEIPSKYHGDEYDKSEYKRKLRNPFKQSKKMKKR